jgi:hypothetical protein
MMASSNSNSSMFMNTTRQPTGSAATRSPLNYFMGAQGSSSHSQELSTCPYPQAQQFCPQCPMLPLKDSVDLMHPPTL